MPPPEKSGAAWPDVPPSLHHESFEMSELNKDQLQAHADTAPDVTPYLGLRARLSQLWFNRWTLLLILVMYKVITALDHLNDQIAEAEVKALSACTKVEDIGSAYASMPHYLSVGVNALAADGMSKAVHGMVEVMMMILTAVEEIILFIINWYYGNWICMTSAYVHGGLDVSVGAVEGASKIFNDNIGTISGGISSDLQSVQDAINSAWSKISGLTNTLGISPPKIDISGRLDDLKNIKVDPTEFVNDLVKLNMTLPTYDQAEKLMRETISVPFDLIKNSINNSYSGYAFDKTIFPVAEKRALTFCSGNTSINDFFNSLFKIAASAKIGFIVVLAILAVLFIIPMTYLEIRKWRQQQRYAYIFTKNGYDPMDVVYTSSRPLTSTFAIKLVSRFQGKRQLWVRWAIAYATTYSALFVLSLALAGFFACICQAIILATLQKEAPALASQVGGFANEVVSALEDVSASWASNANGVVANMNAEINKDLFGYVSNATTAVNNTVTGIENELNKVLNQAFNGTILYNAVNGLVRCIIGIKLDAVEKGLTWVHDQAQVRFPNFPNDTFSLGAAASISGDSDLTSFLATPASVTTDEITAAIDNVIASFRSTIIKEALISAILFMIYILVVLIGVTRAAIGMIGHDKTRAEGGRRYVTNQSAADANSTAAGFTGDGRSPPSPRMAGANARFPKFGGDFSAVEDDYVASAVRDEKLAAAAAYNTETTSSVRAGKASGVKNAGHWRTSSHGYVEDGTGGK